MFWRVDGIGGVVEGIGGVVTLHSTRVGNTRVYTELHSPCKITIQSTDNVTCYLVNYSYTLKGIPYGPSLCSISPDIQ